MKTLLSFLMILSLMACASGHHEKFSKDTPVVRDLPGLYNELNKMTGLSKNLSLQEIGNITYDGFKSSILHVAYRSPDSSKKKYKILIEAGIHGNEPAGVAFVRELIGRLADGSTPLADYDLDIIPVVNPWGWSHDIRFNMAGIDINRDFSSHHSQEARIIINFFKDRRYDLVMDLHEDPKAQGVYFYQYARDDKTLLNRLVAEVKSSGYNIENNVNMILLKTKNGIIDAPMWGLWYVKLTGQLSLSNYCRMYLSGNVFTIETPTNIPLDKRVFCASESGGIISRFTAVRKNKSQ